MDMTHPSRMRSSDIREPIKGKGGKGSSHGRDSPWSMWAHLREESQSRDREKRDKRRDTEPGRVVGELVWMKL